MTHCFPVQSNTVTEMSWINATLLWADAAQSIGDGSIYDLNMTDGLSSNQFTNFQVGFWHDKTSAILKRPLTNSMTQGFKVQITPVHYHAWLRWSILEQAASSYNQEPMSLEGIQTMVNAVTSLGQSGPAYVEHKMLGVGHHPLHFKAGVMSGPLCCDEKSPLFL